MQDCFLSMQKQKDACVRLILKQDMWVHRQLLEGFPAISVSLYIPEWVSQKSRTVFVVLARLLKYWQTSVFYTSMYVALRFVEILAAPEQASQLEGVL